MAYFVNGTDGNITAVVEDGTINTDTSLKLIGIGYPQYAETVAENFVGLLENFSSPNAPSNPIKGQTWFNTSINQLQVFDGDIFRAVNNVKVSDSEPFVPREGDFWYDSINKQMFFRRGLQWQLVAPAYNTEQGRTELVAEWITDINDVQHVVLTFFNNGKRALIIGTDDKFRTTTFNGFSWINPGINIPDYLQKSSGVFWAGNGNAYADSGVTVGGSTTQIQYNNNGFLAGASIFTNGTDLTSTIGTFQSKNLIANEIKSSSTGYVFPDNTTQTTAAIIDANTVSGNGDLFSMAYFDDTADSNSISGTPQITTDGINITAQAGTITAKNLSLTQSTGGKLTFADGTQQTTAAFNNAAAVNGTGVVNQLAYFTSTTQVSGTPSITTNGQNIVLTGGTITLVGGEINMASADLMLLGAAKITFADGTTQSTAASTSSAITGSGGSTRLAYFTGTSSVSGATSITTNGSDITVGAGKISAKSFVPLSGGTGADGAIWKSSAAGFDYYIHQGAGTSSSFWRSDGVYLINPLGIIGQLQVSSTGTTLAGQLTVGTTGIKFNDNTTQTTSAIGAVSKTANGYQKIPGGIIIQWGTGVTVTANGDTVTFPIPFPTAVTSVVVTESNAAGWPPGSTAEPTIYGVSNSTITNFKVYGSRILSGTQPTGVGLSYSWQAIGY